MISRTLFLLPLAALLVVRMDAQTPARPSTAAHLQAQGDKRPGEFKTFRGSLGKYRVQMRLRRDGNAIAGTYFYEHVKTDLRLEGTIDAAGRFTLREFDAGGAQTGLFDGAWGTVSEEDPEVSLSGQWSRPDGTHKMEFSLNEMSLNFAGGARLLTREIKESDKRHNYAIDVAYPQIEGMPAARVAGFNEAARSLAAKEAADFRKSMADYEQGSRPDNGSSLDVDYYVDYADDDLVSVGFNEDSFYSGAAHPNHATIVLNYDLKAGRALRLADLFEPGSPYLKVISDYCMAKLKGDSDLGSDDEWIKEGASPKAANYRSWLVKKDGLEITFDAYQVASYAAGPQYVTVPFDALKKIVRPGGPLAPFVR
jgi:Protein of unknown function (DUF3298)/Deacetylase PdaC